MKTPALLKLDLACGQNKREGFLGVDRAKAPGVDRVVDLMKFPWPWKDASVEEAHCSHYIEHIPLEDYQGKDRLCWFMDELHRILIPGGQATIIAPWWASVRCWQDPTHRRPITDLTFWYFNKAWRAANRLDHYPIVADFEPVLSYNGIANDVMQRHEEARMFALNRYLNTFADVQVVLTKR